MLPTGISFRKALIWTIRVVLAVAFVLAGVPKILKDPQWMANFELWGFPGWFRMLVGWAEVLGALALVNSRLVLYAAAALAMIMVGAAVTQLVNNGAVAMIYPFVLVLLCMVVAADRWPHVMRRDDEQDAEFSDYEDQENVEAKLL